MLNFRLGLAVITAAVSSHFDGLVLVEVALSSDSICDKDDFAVVFQVAITQCAIGYLHRSEGKYLAIIGALIASVGSVCRRLSFPP